MTPVVVTTTDPDGWWWARGGVLASTDDALISVVLPSIAELAERTSGTTAELAEQTFAVHLLNRGQTALTDRFARDPYDFDGLAVAHGIGGLPLLTSVPDRLYCQVVRTVTVGETTRLFGVPAPALIRAA